MNTFLTIFDIISVYVYTLYDIFSIHYSIQVIFVFTTYMLTFISALGQ